MKLIRIFKCSKGFTLVELLTSIAIIGILGAVGIQQYTQYKVRGYDAHSKQALHDMNLTCKAYWTENETSDECDLAKAKEFGFVENSDVVATLPSSPLDNFCASAKHNSSPNTFSTDSVGLISSGNDCRGAGGSLKTTGVQVAEKKMARKVGSEGNDECTVIPSSFFKLHPNPNPANSQSTIGQTGANTFLCVTILYKGMLNGGSKKPDAPGMIVAYKNKDARTGLCQSVDGKCYYEDPNHPEYGLNYGRIIIRDDGNVTDCSRWGCEESDPFIGQVRKGTSIQNFLKAGNTIQDVSEDKGKCFIDGMANSKTTVLRDGTKFEEGAYGPVPLLTNYEKLDDCVRNGKRTG